MSGDGNVDDNGDDIDANTDGRGNSECSSGDDVDDNNGLLPCPGCMMVLLFTLHVKHSGG